MKRLIVFPKGEQKKNQQRFELLYGAILLGAKPDKPRGGIEVFRREGRILDALESIAPLDTSSEAKPLGANEPGRKVHEDGGEFELQQADFDYLLEQLKTVDWLPTVARKVVDAVDWLTLSVEVKPAE